MSYNNSNGGKQFKGIPLSLPVGPSGEPLSTTKLDYTGPCGDVKYLGEAKAGSKEIDNRWYIECFEYDSYGNVICIEVACNQLTTKATEVTIDTTSNPGFVRIAITGGVFFKGYIQAGDKITLNTGTNSFGNVRIEQILSDTEVLIKATASDETGASITESDLILTIESDLKDFKKRRWDLRSFYLYA